MVEPVPRTPPLPGVAILVLMAVLVSLLGWLAVAAAGLSGVRDAEQAADLHRSP